MQKALDQVRRSATVSLPDFNQLRRQAKDLAQQVTIGRSAFLRKFDIQSELEYKQQALRIGCTTIGNLSQFFTFEEKS